MTRAPRAKGERYVWWFAFAAFVVIGVNWTMAMPLLFQPDEPSHAMRAAAVARGEFTWNSRETVVYDNFFFVRRTNTVVDIPEGYATLENIPVCGAIVGARDASCAAAVSPSDRIVEARPYTGTYPPLAAIIQSPGGYFDAPVGLVVMRLFTVLVTSVLLASALVAARRLGGGFAAVGLGLALTPVTLSLMASINPSAIEIAAAVCLWVSLIDVLRPGPVDRRAVWRAVIAACFFLLSRPLSPGLFLTIVVALMIAMPWRAQVRTILRERRAWLWVASVVAAFVLAIAWIIYARPDRGFVGYPDNKGTADEIRESLSRIPRRTRELVGPLGWLDVALPDVVVWGWLAVTAVVLAVALWVASWRRRLALTLMVAGTLLGPSLVELPSSGEYGLIWQGRYTLPFALGIPLLAGWTIRERGLDRARALRIVGVTVIVGVVAANLVAVAAALTRHATGRSWPLHVVFGAQPWSADVRGWVVLTVAAIGLVGLGVLLGLLARRSATEAGVC